MNDRHSPSSSPLAATLKDKTLKGWPDEVQCISYTSTFDHTQQCMLFYQATQENTTATKDYGENVNDGASDVENVGNLDKINNKDECNDDHNQQKQQQTNKKRPLLVALHTWSSTYKQTSNGSQSAYARWCTTVNWHFIHPDFRGPNWTYDACGSDAALQDIRDAISYVKANCDNVDEDRIYGVGVSGGGHMGLLLAGKMPDVWAGISVWAPIVDLRVWWEERVNGVQGARRYARHIEKIVGGRPDNNDIMCYTIKKKSNKDANSDEGKEKKVAGKRIAEECRQRSPITHLKHAINSVNIDINAGVYDGRDNGGAVPFTHALNAYNALMSRPGDRLDDEFITNFYENQSPLASSTVVNKDGNRCNIDNEVSKSIKSNDVLYDKKKIIFRKESKYARVTIFQGGHEIIHNAALNWLASQRRGQPAVWDSKDVYYCMNVKDDVYKSGK